MKKIVFIVILLSIIAVSSMLILKKHNQIDGKIITIDNMNRIITIKNGDQVIDLRATSKTRLYDQNNQPALFNDFNVGFVIAAALNKNSDSNDVEKIKIVSSPNIIIITPENNGIVKNNFQIKGVARVFENVLQVQVVDKKTKQIIFNSPVMARPLDIGLFGPFEITVDFPYQNNVNQIEVSAFQYSAKDGSVIDKTTINLEVVK